jgi:predicted small lipoprotein YifL
MQIPRSIVALVLILLVAGCGQKGPLYLEDGSAEATPSASDQPAADEDEDDEDGDPGAEEAPDP